MTKELNNQVNSDYTNVILPYEIPALNTDGVTSQEETEWTNPFWTKYWGIFNSSGDFKSAILMKAIWTVGKGYTTDAYNKVILDQISGWGKDTFDDIIFNMEVIKRVNGDAYCQVIRDDNGTLLNLKPLDPGSMKHIVNKQGQIIRYEQISKVPNKEPKKFELDEIFHLCHNRLADQIHGTSDLVALEKTIQADEENFDNISKVMRYQAKPFFVWKLKTDDPGRIQEVKRKIEQARKLGEDTFIPDDDNAVEFERVEINLSASIFEWQNNLRNKFYRTVGLPLVIFGAASGTESGSKVEYLAHEQIFEKDQRYLEKQIENQLGIKLNFIPPVTLLENLQTDEAKDNQNALTFQPSDVNASTGR